MADVSSELWTPLTTTRPDGQAKPPKQQSGFTPNLNDVLAIAELNFGDFAQQSSASEECSVLLQAFLDYAGFYALALKGTDLDDQNVRSYVRVVIPRGNWKIKYQIVVPEWVDLHIIGTLVRAQGGPLAVNRYRPMILFVANSAASRVNLYCQEDNSPEVGSGVVFGQSWTPDSYTIAARGTNYEAGDEIILPQPAKDLGRFFAPRIKVLTVDANKSILTFDVMQRGIFSRRPFTPETSATRPTVPGALISAAAVDTTPMELGATFAQVSTTGNGAGATFTPNWGSEFKVNDRGITSYRTGFAVQTDMLIGQVRVNNAGTRYSQTYGGMFAVNLNLFNADIDRITVQGGYFGIIAQCTDVRANYLNVVSSMIGMVVQGNLFTCPNVVLDTCFFTYLEILPNSSGVTLAGRTLWPKFNDLLEDYLGPVNSCFAFIVGQNWYDEVTPLLCDGIKLDFALVNSGSAPRTTTGTLTPSGPATLFIANIKNSHINIETSNNFRDPETQNKVFKQHTAYGPNVDGESVLITGTTDGITRRAVRSGSTMLMNSTGAASVASGGTGYKLYDLVRLNSTGNVVDAVYQVVGASQPGGVVTAVRIIGPGLYTAIADAPIPTVAVKRYRPAESGDAYGSGLTLSVPKYGNQDVPQCGVAIRDGLMPGWVRDYGICEIFKAGAPVDGTSGTAVNRAQPGSRYTNLTTGDVYINTGTIGSPLWKKVTLAL